MTKKRLFPGNRNDLGGVRAPYCYLAAAGLWIPCTATIFYALPPILNVTLGGLSALAYGSWLAFGWRRETRKEVLHDEIR